MVTDLFDDILELENEFYKEGFDAGAADSEYAGMIEGKVFGIEKGYEKALELGKLRGRALIWQARLAHPGDGPSREDFPNVSHAREEQSSQTSLEDVHANLSKLPSNIRLQKHIEALLALTDSDTVATDNSDEAVADFDERLSRAKAKAKVIANVAGENLNPTMAINAGIEDATGLDARH